MRILNLRRSSGAGSLVATFDLEATPEITLLDWQLRSTPKGLRVFPPSPRSGRSSAQVEARTFSEIGRLAAATYKEGDVPHDQTNVAA